MQRRRLLRRTAVRRRLLDTVPVSGRPAASRLEWQAIQSQVRSRAGWRCEACGRRGRLDVHHIIKRSRGGSDFNLDHLVALCRTCHDQTDAPLAAGRLIVTPLGEGRFGFEVMYGPAKYRWPSRASGHERPEVWGDRLPRLAARGR
jgi:5-methylcytosine-specific restriction endonuclease McrA